MLSPPAKPGVYLTELPIHEALSTADIAAIDSKNETERREIEQEKARLDREWKARYPEYELLKESYGLSKALKTAFLLADIREKGRDHVSASMPKSTWYRLVRELREVGIELPE